MNLPQDLRSLSCILDSFKGRAAGFSVGNRRRSPWVIAANADYASSSEIFIFGMPFTMGNTWPLSGQTRSPSTTCRSMSTRWSASTKVRSSSAPRSRSGGKESTPQAAAAVTSALQSNVSTILRMNSAFNGLSRTSTWRGTMRSGNPRDTSLRLHRKVLCVRSLISSTPCRVNEVHCCSRLLSSRHERDHPSTAEIADASSKEELASRRIGDD
mmetsp:Transcript_22661/g.65970  ORF Transcript_22661/g.65970 Transcript_22661/m.65970 type:complete len:213 (+) Transcript_22661:191-829(+)